jgi:hypothetical protein
MAIAFFFAGETSSDFDQSKSNGTASRSLRTAVAISLSLRASMAAPSVFPGSGLSRETTVIFPPLVGSGAAGGDEPADFAEERAGDRNLALLDGAEDLIPDFATAIPPADECWSAEYASHVLEVDLVRVDVGGTPVAVPAEGANLRDQALDVLVFRHSAS